MKLTNKIGFCSNFLFLVCIFSLLILISSSVSASSPTYLSDSIFEDRASVGRNLLQTKKACPVNFENLNYSVVTSQCKGPKYPPDVCCGALKELACPYSEDLNDLSNDCATIMFSYLNKYGNYPDGVFAHECREEKLGLVCPDSKSDNVSASCILQNPKPLLVLTTCLTVLLLPLI